MMGFQQNDPQWSKTLDDPKKVSEALERAFGQADEQLKNMLGIPMAWPDDASLAPKEREFSMTSQDRYIDARLTGIESKLDARMEAMQRFSEQSEARNRELIERIEHQAEQSEKRFKEAESRFERASDRHSAEVSLLSQKFDARFDETRRHTTMVGIGVFAVIAIIAGLSWYWVSEQGSYAKSYGETQVEIQRASDELAEFRQAVQSIQATQQSILERLPPPSDE